MLPAVYARAVQSTALRLSLALALAGCATGGEQTASGNLPAFHQQRMAQQMGSANRLAAESAAVQVAGNSAATTYTDAEQPLLKQGRIILRRTEEAVPPPSAEETEARLRRLASSMAAEAVAAREDEILARASASAGATADAYKAYAQQVAQQTARETVTQASPEVQQAIRQMANQAILERDQPVEYAVRKIVEARLTEAANDPVQQAISKMADDVASARTENLAKTLTASQQAELESLKAETARQLALLQQAQGITAAQAKEDARLQAEAAKLAVTETVAQRIAAAANNLENQQTTQLAQLRQEQGALEARLQQTQTVAAAQAKEDARLQTEAVKLQANQQIAALDAKYENRLRLQSEQAEQIAKALRDYTTEQFNKVAADTSASLAVLAVRNETSTTMLREATAQRLEQIREGAEKQALEIATQKADEVATRVAMLAEKTQAQMLSPEQVKTIADTTLLEASPSIKALALQTLGESEGYIKTVARGAVTDGDPAMQEALANAAKQAVVKDDRIVFAIKKVVDERLKEASFETAAANARNGGEARTLIGPDGKPTVIEGGDVVVDADKLKIGALREPGKNSTAYERQLASSGAQPSIMGARQRADWIDLKKYRVVLHEDATPLESLMAGVLKRAEPYTGPWQLKWKISDENQDILQEKFSLDAETTFEEFVGYLANYMVNYRGIKLSFNLFESERVLVISD